MKNNCVENFELKWFFRIFLLNLELYSKTQFWRLFSPLETEKCKSCFLFLLSSHTSSVDYRWTHQYFTSNKAELCHLEEAVALLKFLFLHFYSQEVIILLQFAKHMSLEISCHILITSKSIFDIVSQLLKVNFQTLDVLFPQILFVHLKN